MAMALSTFGGFLAPASSGCQLSAASWHRPVTPPGHRLQVTRVVEETRQRGQAGRMRITGRMADVCAELERLARLEAH